MAGKFKANQVLQIGLAHIEKVVLAGIGLFVVYVLIYEPLMGDVGKWSVFKTHPNEFQAKVEAEARLDAQRSEAFARDNPRRVRRPDVEEPVEGDRNSGTGGPSGAQGAAQ